MDVLLRLQTQDEFFCFVFSSHASPAAFLPFCPQDGVETSVSARAHFHENAPHPRLTLPHYSAWKEIMGCDAADA